MNRTTSLDDPHPQLAKRVFTPVTTQAQIATFLVKQFNGNFDPAYGSPAALVDNEGTDNTVVVQNVFGKNGFAIGATAIHGCTMITVVSNRAVHMVSLSLPT